MDVPRLRQEVERLVRQFSDDFASGFIMESPDELRKRVIRYFSAAAGLEPYPVPHCNAPWVSAVIDSDGAVRPCFFHAALGNIHEQSLSVILNSGKALAFRSALDMKTNRICRTCVCTLFREVESSRP